jgi:predicted nucleotidyltransferase
VASRSEIRGFAKALAERFAPERIVLFGSHARGNAGADSDVDLLIVMPHEGPAALRAAEIRKTIRSPFAVDLLVRSPDRLRERLRMGDPFLAGIVAEGEVLYEAAKR